MNKAHNLVTAAIANGTLLRLDCEVCGAPKTHAHHDDYARPMAVRWLCAPHHRAWHRDNEALNREPPRQMRLTLDRATRARLLDYRDRHAPTAPTATVARALLALGLAAAEKETSSDGLLPGARR